MYSPNGMIKHSDESINIRLIKKDIKFNQTSKPIYNISVLHDNMDEYGKEYRNHTNPIEFLKDFCKYCDGYDIFVIKIGEWEYAPQNVFVGYQKLRDYMNADSGIILRKSYFDTLSTLFVMHYENLYGFRIYRLNVSKLFICTMSKSSVVQMTININREKNEISYIDLIIDSYTKPYDIIDALSWVNFSSDTINKILSTIK